LIFIFHNNYYFISQFKKIVKDLEIISDSFVKSPIRLEKNIKSSLKSLILLWKIFHNIFERLSFSMIECLV